MNRCYIQQGASHKIFCLISFVEYLLNTVDYICFLCFIFWEREYQFINSSSQCINDVLGKLLRSDLLLYNRAGEQCQKQPRINFFMVVTTNFVQMTLKYHLCITFRYHSAGTYQICSVFDHQNIMSLHILFFF